MVSRRQKCCEGVDCTCEACLNDKASCCYVIVYDSEDYFVVWDGDCSWVNPPDESSATMSITGTTLAVTVGATELSASISVDEDCLAFDGFSVEGASVYASDQCYTCACYCSECAEVDVRGMNSPCCYTTIIGSTKYYLAKTGDCTWGDECEIATLSLASGTITLTVGEVSWELEYTEAPDCCETSFTFPEGGPVVYASDSTECSDGRLYLCAAVSVSGIDLYNDDCGCPACGALNTTYYFPAGQTTASGYYAGMVLSYDGACYEGSPLKRCSYNQVALSIDASTNEVTFIISSSGDPPDPITGYMIFTGTFDPDTMTASLSLSSQSAESAYDCDGSSATVSLSLSSSPYNCPDVCPDNSVACEDPPACSDFCFADSIPGSVSVLFPSGYFQTNAGKRWTPVGCDEPGWCGEFPDGDTVVCETGTSTVYAGSATLPDVGDGTKDVTLFSDFNGQCGYKYFSDVFQTTPCSLGSGGSAYWLVLVMQWSVEVDLEDSEITLAIIIKVYTANQGSGVWLIISTKSFEMNHPFVLDTVCETALYNCWPNYETTSVTPTVSDSSWWADRPCHPDTTPSVYPTVSS